MDGEYKLCDKCGKNETARVVEGEYICTDCFLESHGIKPVTNQKQLPPGMYMCTRCNSPHKAVSKIGKRHLKYQ